MKSFFSNKINVSIIDDLLNKLMLKILKVKSKDGIFQIKKLCLLVVLKI